MIAKEKAMCVYDCDRCGKEFRDELYPTAPQNGSRSFDFLCPSCKEAVTEIEATEVVLAMAKRCLPDDIIDESDYLK